MKTLTKITLTLLVCVAATLGVNAQNKIAHIDVQELLSEMPQMKAAQAELKKLQQAYRADIENSMTELQNKYNQYSDEATSKSEEENQKRALELQEFERNIQEAEQAAVQEIQKKQQELFTPISEKAKTAIEKVAARQNIDYVIDASPGLSLIVAKGKDLLSAVKQELGF